MRVARELAKFPKSFRTLIWKRALQITDRKKPTYETIQEAAKEIVPAKEVQKIWLGQLLERLRHVKRLLTMSINLQGVSREGVEEVAKLLVDIEKRISELSIEVGERIKEIKKEERKEE